MVTNYNIYKIVDKRTQITLFIGMTINNLSSLNDTAFKRLPLKHVIEYYGAENMEIHNIITLQNKQEADKQLVKYIYDIRPRFNIEIRGNIYTPSHNIFKLPPENSTAANRLVVCLNTVEIDTCLNICKKYQFNIKLFSLACNYPWRMLGRHKGEYLYWTFVDGNITQHNHDDHYIQFLLIKNNIPLYKGIIKTSKDNLKKIANELKQYNIKIQVINSNFILYISKYTIYKIINHNNEILFIGYTNKNLDYIGHYYQLPLLDTIKQYGQKNMHILTIQDNITSWEEANKLYYQYMQQLKPKYTLNNIDLYNQKIAMTAGKLNPRAQKIKCTTTGEIFDTINDCIKHFNISRSQFYKIINNKASQIKQNQPLQFEYLSNKPEESIYKLYKILQDNIPCYLNITSIDQQEILNMHSTKRQKTNDQLFNAINKYGIEHFSLQILDVNTDITPLQNQLEELYIQYSSKYILYNINRHKYLKIYQQHHNQLDIPKCNNDQPVVIPKYAIDETKKYTVYHIINKINNTPCYVGQTCDNLKARLIQHYTNSEEPLYQFIKKYQKENFIIEPINDQTVNLTKKQANDLEKKYIRDYAQQYSLLNKNLYKGIQVSKEILIDNRSTIDNIDKYPNAIICLNTNTVFPSLSDAMRKTNLKYNSLHHAVNLGLPAGFDEDNMPLYWQYYNKSTIIQTIEKKYCVYIISQLINDDWIPIYVGCTSTSLTQRLNAHYNDKSCTLYPILNSLPKNCIQIKVASPEEQYTNFNTFEEASNAEEQLTITLSKQYKLYNKYCGRHVVNNEYNIPEVTKLTNTLDENIAYICIETKQYFASIHDIATTFDINYKDIKQNTNIIINNYHFKKLNVNNYYILLIKYNDNNYIIDCKGIFNQTNLNTNDYTFKIQYSKIEFNNLKVYVLEQNINSLQEALALKEQYINHLINLDKNIQNIVFTAGNKERTTYFSLSKMPIICVETNKTFDCALTACRFYNIAVTNMKRLLNGVHLSVFSKELNCNLSFKFLDSNISIQNNGICLYYILHNDNGINKPVGVIVTNRTSSEVLPSLKSAPSSQLGKEIVKNNYDTHLLSLVQNNILDLKSAKIIKLQHINLLCALGYQLYSTKI